MERLQIINIAESTLSWDPSVNMIWLGTMALLGSTLFLLAYTLWLRFRIVKADRKTKKFEQSLLPILFQYMDGEIGRSEMSQLVGDDKLNCKVFERTVIRLLKNLEGEEAEKLRSALVIKPVFNHHLKQLKSRHIDLKIKACLYFRHVTLQEPSIIRSIKKEVTSKNTFLAFSAASALMGSLDFSARNYALNMLAKNKKLSEMAIMELFYRYRNEELSSEPDMSAALKNIIADPEVSSSNRAILIRCVAESNFYHLRETLYEWLRSENTMWSKPEVLIALIESQKIFLNIDAADDIVHHVYHDNASVARAAEIALGKLTSEEFSPEKHYRLS